MLSLDRLSAPAPSGNEVDDLLQVAICLLVEASGLDVGVLRVGKAGRLRARASVGLDDEVEAGFATDTDSCSAAATAQLSVLPLDDPRVSDTMRERGVRKAYWLTLPHPAVPLAACLGGSSTADLSAERRTRLQLLGKRVAGAIGRCHILTSLEEGLLSREQVLADLAHDLKNSMNAVTLSATILDQQLNPASTHRAIIDRITRNTRRAANLLENWLSSSTVEAGKLVLRRDVLDAAELVLSVPEGHQDTSLDRAIVMATDVAPGLGQVRADRERILEVFDNLVGNAFKFTNPGGCITVGAAQAGDEVVFSVRDTGRGIPAEQLARVFERYFRAQPDDRNGSGLGLSICKGIVEAHGGRIWAESTVGVGTAMLFTLPVFESQPVSQRLARANVLIVDDRLADRTALEAILEGPDYRIVTAASGAEALRIAPTQDLSVVLIDIEMPGMSGFETASHLKRVKRTKALPIIFITAHGHDSEQIYRAYAAGAADYLVKPLDPEIVRRKVAVFAELGRRRSQKDSEPPDRGLEPDG